VHLLGVVAPGAYELVCISIVEGAGTGIPRENPSRKWRLKEYSQIVTNAQNPLA
jgi:hypothetical protein